MENTKIVLSIYTTQNLYNGNFVTSERFHVPFSGMETLAPQNVSTDRWKLWHLKTFPCVLITL